MLLHFYCDESYDCNPKKPNIINISGFLSDQPTWEEVEKDWNEINHRYGVPYFHATDLNGAKKKYNGWSKQKRDCYSAELLKSINCKSKKMRAYNCGMRADEYRNIISESDRKKLGPPWIVCFNSCITMITKDMENLPPDYSILVFLEKGSEFDKWADEIFRWLVKNPDFKYQHRLTNLTFGSKELVGLQVADLMAYEYFKRLKDKEKKVEPRIPLKLIREHNAYEEGYFGKKTWENMKDAINSNPDLRVIIPSL